MKTDVAVRRLERLEREQDEQDDHDREASMTEAFADKTKVVKLVVDKWFVDRGFGFGKVPTGEIVFIHASAVVGAEVLTIGTNAWVQVVNDDARAQGVYRASRQGQRESEQGGPTGKASSGTDLLSWQLSPRRRQLRCATSRRGLTSSPGTLRRLTWVQVAHTSRPQ